MKHQFIHNTAKYLFAIMLFYNITNGQSWQPLGGPLRAHNPKIFTMGYGFGEFEEFTVYGSNNGKIIRWAEEFDQWVQETQTMVINPLVMACDPVKSDTVLVGLDKTIYLSYTGGGYWGSDPVINEDGLVPLVLQFAPEDANPDRVFLGAKWVDTNHSALRKSTDRGATWSEIPTFRNKYRASITSIAYHPDSINRIYVGARSINSLGGDVAEIENGQPVTDTTRGIFFTKNGGTTWNPKGLVGRNVKAIVIYKNRIFAGTVTGAFFKSNLTADTAWEQLNDDDFPTVDSIYSITSDNGYNIFIATNRGIVHNVTDDTFEFMEEYPGMYDENVSSVLYDPDGSNLYATSPTSIFFSDDDANYWLDYNAGLDVTNVSAVGIYNGEVFTGSREVNALGDYASGDWSNEVIWPGREFRTEDIALKNDSVVYLSGQSENDAWIFRRNQIGTYDSIMYQPTGIANTIAIDPKHSNYLYSGGKFNLYYNFARSMNNGEDWDLFQIGPNVSGQAIEVYSFATDSSGQIQFAGLKNRGVWKSTDGGSNWSQTFTKNTTINAVATTRQNPLIAFAGGDSLWKTTNGGTSWTAVNGITNITKIVFHSFVSTSIHLWVLCDNGQKIYKTGNSGATWVSVNVSNLPKPINDLRQAEDDFSVMYAGTSGGLWKINTRPATPTGISVAQVTVSGIHRPKVTWNNNNTEPDLKHPRYMLYYYLRQWQFETEDWGEPGPTIYFATADTTFYIDYQDVTSHVEWEWQRIGYMVRAVDSTNETSLSSAAAEINIEINDGPPDINKVRTSGIIPKVFSLEKNYPNPFNPSTTIKYGLPVDATVLLKVYNATGQEVATLIDELETAGYKQVEFNATNISSGIYFYRLTANGKDKSFTQVRKMLLIK